MSIQTFRVGGFVTDTVSDIINLYAGNTLNGRASTFRKANQSAGSASGYQVTSGKTFYIAQIIFSYGDDTSSNIGVGFGYADNDVGFDSTTGRINPFNIIGNPESGSVGSNYGIAFDGTPQLVGSRGEKFSFDGIWKAAPGGKYMYMVVYNAAAATGLGVQITGFEV